MLTEKNKRTASRSELLMRGGDLSRQFPVGDSFLQRLQSDLEGLESDLIRKPHQFNLVSRFHTAATSRNRVGACKS